MKAKHRVPRLTPELETMDTRVVPSVVGLGHGFQARAALAQHALRNVGSTPAFRFPLSGNTRLNTPTLQSTNITPFGRQVVFPASFGSATSSSRAAMLKLATPPSQPARSVVVPSSSAQISAAPQASASTDIGDVKNGPLAKAGQDLIAVYQAFGPSGTGHLTSSGGASVEVVGSSVGVQVRTSGDVNALVATLTGMGMQVQGTDPNTHIVAGLLPIAQLPNLAQLSQVTSIIPITIPRLA
jgi:hypothetical protein